MMLMMMMMMLMSMMMMISKMHLKQSIDISNTSYYAVLLIIDGSEV